MKHRLFRLFLEPHPRLTDPRHRATAGLFAGCLLTLIVLFASYDAFLSATRPGYQPPWMGYVLMISAYALLRSGLYVVAAGMTLCMFPLVAFGLVVSGHSTNPVATLTFPVLSILLATLLLDAVGTAAIGMLTSILVVLTTAVDAPGRMPFATVSGPLLVNVLGTAIGVVSIVHRNRLERERRRVLEMTAAELEKRVAERTAELAQTVAELESFSYSVSHDLKAPLTAIKGFSAMLSEDHGERLGSEGLELVSVIDGSAERMSSLIDGLLELSRMARATVERQQVDLVPLARETLTTLRAAELERRVDFRCPEHLILSCDPLLARVVLQNLLGNAWKFTAKREDARIEFGREPYRGQDFCVVRDNGAGFDMKGASRLFQPFERLHASDDFPGTGIGLATVQRVVLRHGGSVFAESSPGAGAAFFFNFQSN